MSDFDDDEPPIFYERRPKEVFNKDEKASIQSTESDSEIMILSNHDKNTEKKSQDNLKNGIPSDIHQNNLLDSLLNDSDSSSDSVCICSSPINSNFPKLLENLSSSQPTSLSLELNKQQESSQPVILSVGSESESDSSEKDDFQELNFEYIRKKKQNSQNLQSSQNSQELFNFSFQSRDLQAKQKNAQNEQTGTSNHKTKEEVQNFISAINKLRENFVKSVNEEIKKFNAPIPYNVDVSRPPVYETMSDDELQHELAGYGFRFKSREDAISKLFRCWSAVREKESLQVNSTNNKASKANLNPIDFIRIHSKFYEQILIYQPIPLASLHREMNEAGLKISFNRLKSILDDEGVAFYDDINAIHPAK